VAGVPVALLGLFGCAALLVNLTGVLVALTGISVARLMRVTLSARYERLSRGSRSSS
jgi:hypothetical protein